MGELLLEPYNRQTMNVYFSDWFGVDPAVLADYGAFNVSLINDLPLFIDPFLLFTSKKPEYQKLHDRIIDYLKFLRDRSAEGAVDEGLLRAWFMFPEVKELWLGFSLKGNQGSGLGIDFARALHKNLNNIFRNFGEPLRGPIDLDVDEPELVDLREEGGRHRVPGRAVQDHHRFLGHSTTSSAFFEAFSSSKKSFSPAASFASTIW